MKVLLIVGGYPLLTETFILNQITGLVQRGVQIELYSKKRRPKNNKSLVAPNCNLDELVQIRPEVPQGYMERISVAIELLKLRKKSIDPFTLLRSLNFLKYKREAASLRLMYSAIPFLEKKSYDIIHAQFGSLGLNALALKQVGVISGRLVTSFRGSDATRRIKNDPRRYLELFEKGDLFLAVSEKIKEKLISSGCPTHKIRVHHSGIDCTKFRYAQNMKKKEQPFCLISIGRLVEKKGFKYSIEAVARVLASGRQVNYLILGDGELKDELQDQIASLGMEPNIHLLGWKSHEEVIEIMRRADILIAPSVTAADGDQEGIPNSVKEAMAMGLPVISTLHGGIPELVEDGASGLLVPEADTEALAARINRLLDDPEACTRMGVHGRQCVNELFDIERLNDELISIYASLTDPFPQKVPYVQ